MTLNPKPYSSRWSGTGQKEEEEEEEEERSLIKHLKKHARLAVASSWQFYSPTPHNIINIFSFADVVIIIYRLDIRRYHYFFLFFFFSHLQILSLFTDQTFADIMIFLSFFFSFADIIIIYILDIIIITQIIYRSDIIAITQMIYRLDIINISQMIYRLDVIIITQIIYRSDIIAITQIPP